MIHLELITSKGTVYSNDVHEVILPTTSGLIGVMEHHEHLITVSSEGVISIRNKPGDSDDLLSYIAVSKNGVIEVNGNNVRLLADEAVRDEDIDEKQAEKAYQAAMDLTKNAKDKKSKSIKSTKNKTKH